MSFLEPPVLVPGLTDPCSIRLLFGDPPPPPTAEVIYGSPLTWQVSDVLWCSLLAVNLILETAVTRRVFSTSRVDFSMPSLSTAPSPSSHVI